MKQDSFSRRKDRGAKLEGHKNASPRSKIKPKCDLHNKPFIGRIFYLDLPWNMKTQLLEDDIKLLGGTVEKFFSKEIKYLVSSKPEARYAQRLLPDSPVPSPDSGVSSPHPSSRRESRGRRGSSQGAADMATISRGKSLVEKVVKDQERFQMNGILASAVEWGVKVLYVEDVLSYVDKKKAKVTTATHSKLKGAARVKDAEKSSIQTSSGGQIRRPFVKVEDLSRHYRPIYLSMSNMPVCNLCSLPPCSPFLMEELGKNDPKKNQRVKRSAEERGTRGKEKRPRGHEGREKRKGGYCECCEVKFENVKGHLESEQHRAFSKSDEYQVVDRVIAGLTCDFKNLSTPHRRVKCSSSTPVLIAGTVLPLTEDLVSLMGVWQQESEEFMFFGSTAKESLSERTVETPLLFRKRSRGQSEFPRSNRDYPDIPEKSQSKRLVKAFEWELSLQPCVHETEDVSFHSRKQDSFGCERMADQQTGTKSNYEAGTRTEVLWSNCSENHTQSVTENQVEKSTLLPNSELVKDLNCSRSLQRKVKSVRPRRKRQVPAVHIESSNTRKLSKSCSHDQQIPEQCEKAPVSFSIQ